ncbi:hypothetical protein KH5_09370 [Urechidicola sp. KH5]
MNLISLPLGMIGPFQVLLILLVLVLPIIALVDIVRSKFKGDNDKILWAVVVILAPFIGTILYFLIGRKQKVRN